VLEFVDAWCKGAQIFWGARRSRADPGMREVISRTVKTVLRCHAIHVSPPAASFSWIASSSTVSGNSVSTTA
jgi:hypothetical protein